MKRVTPEMRMLQERAGLEIDYDNEMVINENIDNGMDKPFNRMEEISDTQNLNSFKRSLRIFASDCYNEGFERQDVMAYINSLLDEL